MLKIIIGLFIFCLVLFLYLHIQFHLKTSDDLEVYEIEQASKDRKEEICDLRQPVMFDIEDDKLLQTTSKDYILENYPVFDVKIRNVKEELTPDTEIYMPLPLHMTAKLLDEDKESAYFSENNADFLQETGVYKNFQYNDEFFRPSLVSNCRYDIMFGSNGTSTPFRYELNYRNYFIVTQGSVKVKLAPPKSTKYLYPINDYETFEFKTPVNPWHVQPKYTADFDKIKCLEIVLTPGKCLYIPAYWWYSFKFQKNSSITVLKYRTYMNNIAISPHIFMYALQIQNVKRNIAKTADIKTLNADPIEDAEEEEPNRLQPDGEPKKMTTNIHDLIPEPSSHIASVDVHKEIANEIQSYKISGSESLLNS
jgi:hypothetical protein